MKHLIFHQERSQVYEVSPEVPTPSVGRDEPQLQFRDDLPAPKRRKTLARLGRGKKSANSGKSGAEDLKEEINMVRLLKSNPDVFVLISAQELETGTPSHPR